MGEENSVLERAGVWGGEGRGEGGRGGEWRGGEVQKGLIVADYWSGV
jgi:hypothetical protein